MDEHYYENAGNLERESHSRIWANIVETDRFVGLGKAVSFSKGETILPAGKIPRSCYCVLSGRVIACEYTVATGDRYYNFNEDGSLILEAHMLLGQPSPVNFIAATPVTAVELFRNDLVDALQNDPWLSVELIQSLSFKFLAAMDQVREGSECNVAWKVCNLLLTFADRYGVPYDGKILIKEKLTQQTMANLLGINRITMVRTIKWLREEELIEQVNGFYCIRDKEKLKEFMLEANAQR